MKQSAGILVYRLKDEIEIFLVHPGGPFFKNKDLGVWTIPKGEIEEGEDALEAAKREFFEETLVSVTGTFIQLNPIKQKSGKIVRAWAKEMQIDESKVSSNLIKMEWPPKSGKFQEFPEVDKAGWFKVYEAKEKIIAAQIRLIEELIDLLDTAK